MVGQRGGEGGGQEGGGLQPGRRAPRTVRLDGHIHTENAGMLFMGRDAAMDRPLLSPGFVETIQLRGGAVRSMRKSSGLYLFALSVH